jgi:hypothetical protein
VRTRHGLAVGLAAAALSVSVTATGSTAASATTRAGHATSQQPGYYDSESFIGSEGGEILLSYMRDSHGRTSALMNVGIKPYGQWSLGYLLRKHGATKWSKRRVPGSGKLGLTLYNPAQLVASLSGDRLYLLVDTQAGLYVTSKSAAARNFPPLVSADLKIPYNQYSQATVETDPVPGPIIGGGVAAIAGPHHRLTVLAKTRLPGTDLQTLTTFQIHPSGSVTRRSLPGQCPESYAGAITRDPVTGWVTVVAMCDAVRDDGRVLAWVRHSHRGLQFTGPKQLAPEDDHQQYMLTSLASIDNHVYVGLGSSYGRYMIRGTVGAKSDHWTRPRAFQNTTLMDQGGLLLAVAPRLGVVHAAYNSPGCLKTTTLKPGRNAHWSPPICRIHSHRDPAGGRSKPVFLDALVATNGRGTRLAYLYN